VKSLNIVSLRAAFCLVFNLYKHSLTHRIPRTKLKLITATRQQFRLNPIMKVELLLKEGGRMTYQELREQIAQMIFHQTTMERDWDARKDWVKDQYRKDADEIFKAIQAAGWVLQPKDTTISEN